jgi:hypothetical protein
MEDKPIKPLDAHAIGKIPRRQKSTTSQTATINGNGDVAHTNGADTLNCQRAADASDAEGPIRKRPAPDTVDGDGPISKRGKITHNGTAPADGSLIVLDDSTNGAIVIDDD